MPYTIQRLPISDQTWHNKYRYTDALSNRIDTIPDKSIQDTWRRVATALSAVEKEPSKWTQKFYSALQDFKFLPAGRILSGAGTGRRVTLHNCFVMDTIQDSMRDIFRNLGEAAITMQSGGGIGYDFSTLRPKGAPVIGVDSDASGPLSFMECWNSMCKTVMSAGSRRGAMMATLRCDHPDIEAFITAKRTPGVLTNFNLSVLVTDDFMTAVENDMDWELKFNEKVYKTLSAKSLWDLITRTTYDVAEPGVIFIDQINARNNLYYCESIAATNPCVIAGTKILTDRGYFPIEDLVGVQTNVWNGFRWSAVTPSVTGQNVEICKVKLSNGVEITCTPYHSFILREWNKKEVRDIMLGSQLQKTRMPVVNYPMPDFANAYTQGAFSGDGYILHKDRESKQAAIGLYGNKKHLSQYFTGIKSISAPSVADSKFDRFQVYFEPDHLNLDKSFVPESGWSIKSRLDWLAGLLDTDGCAVSNDRWNPATGFQVSSINYEFLLSVRRMLTTLGVSSATVSVMKEATRKLMPDGLGGYKEYDCKVCYRLSVPSSEVEGLLKLGLDTKRLKLFTGAARNATRFVTIDSIVPAGTAEKVYCFNESEFHQGVFEGVLTGNCGEQPLPPYGTCLLGSINFAALVSDAFGKSPHLDQESLKDTIYTAVRMMDNVIEASWYPVERQKEEAVNKRRIGLGVTGLADALAMCGLTYGSPDAVKTTRDWMRAFQSYSYEASVELAKEKGPFPLFDSKRYCAGKTIQGLPHYLVKAIGKHGIRNALVTSIAPTGTISLFADNISSGVEPIFAREYSRKTLQSDGSKTVEVITDYALRLFNHLHPGKDVPAQFVTAQDLTVDAHLAMQAAVQDYIDSSISKTINVPESYPFDDFAEIYLKAYKSGCKGCTTYRPSAARGSVLEVTGGAKLAEPPAPAVPSKIKRPEVIPGVTAKMKWNDDPSYFLTLNVIDGQPYEIFINSKSTVHKQWTDAVSRLATAAFSRGGDISFIANELSQVTDPNGGAWIGGKYVPSLVALMGHKLQELLINLGVVSPDSTIKSEPVQQLTPVPEPKPGEICPKCSAPTLVRKEGCKTCYSCGWSSCG